MSIENKDIIDFASIDKYGNVVLTISDHLQWDKANEHSFQLQEKINSYLSAIESGDLFEKYPLARGKKIAISVVFKFWPSPDGEGFLRRVHKYLSDNGYDFYYEMLVVNPVEDQYSEGHNSNKIDS